MTRTLKVFLSFAVLSLAAALAGTMPRLTPGAGPVSGLRQTS
jgi:hypothetical protein